MPKLSRLLKVFICHASQDKPVVRELAQRLFNEGWIDPWVDEKKLLPGQDWRSRIEEAVETADVVIICISNHSISKEGFVQKELRFAREIALEKPEETVYLIPLRLDDCLVPRGLRFYQWGDYFGENKEETYNLLLASLKFCHEQQLRQEEGLQDESINNVIHDRTKSKKIKKALQKENLPRGLSNTKFKELKRWIVQIFVLAKRIFKTFIPIGLDVSNANYLFRIGLSFGIIVALLWLVGNNLNNNINPAVQSNVTPSLITTDVYTDLSVSYTQTLTPVSTSTFIPTPILLLGHLAGSEILFVAGDNTVYAYSNNEYSKLATMSDLGIPWSWDVEKEIFIYGTQSDNDIYFIDRTGKLVSSLKVPYLNYCPNLSPDGEKIIVESQALNYSSLWVLNVDGSGFRRFSPLTISLGCPAWSPDGKSVAALGGKGIVILDLAGEIIKEIETIEIWSPPKWSPDGKSIILCDMFDGISLYNIEANSQEELLRDSAIDCDWSPDGKYIVYVSPTGLELLEISTHKIANLVKMIDISAVAWK